MPEKKRISLNVMPDLKDYLEERSEETGRTINALLVEMIEKDKKAKRK